MSFLYNVDCQQEENSSPDQRNNVEEKALTSNNEQETAMANEELANCPTLKEDVDREILQDKTAPDVEEAVLDSVSKVDETVSYDKEKLKNINNAGRLDSSLKNTDVEKTNGNEKVGAERMDTSLSDIVLGIVEEIIIKVDENVVKLSENKLNEQSHISLECIDGNQKKHGEKRSYSEVVDEDVGMDVPTLDAAKDSLYIMSLVEAELEAVGQGLEVNNNKKDKPRLVDYDDDDDNSSESSDGESSDTESSDSDSTSSEESFIEQRYVYHLLSIIHPFSLHVFPFQPTCHSHGNKILCVRKIHIVFSPCRLVSVASKQRIILKQRYVFQQCTLLVARPKECSCFFPVYSYLVQHF